MVRVRSKFRCTFGVFPTESAVRQENRVLPAMLTSTIRPKATFPTLRSKLTPIMLSKASAQTLSSGHKRLHSNHLPLPLSKALSFLKYASTRRPNGHCLGTFRAGKYFCTPPSMPSLSLSLSLSHIYSERDHMGLLRKRYRGKFNLRMSHHG
jgi:hypothetical protein